MELIKIKSRESVLIHDILKLYGEENIEKLFNDIVAIGTWPTPEKPTINIRWKKDGTIAVDLVPLPKKSLILGALVYELLSKRGNIKVSKIL